VRSIPAGEGAAATGSDAGADTGSGREFGAGPAVEEPAGAPRDWRNDGGRQTGGNKDSGFAVDAD